MVGHHGLKRGLRSLVTGMALTALALPIHAQWQTEADSEAHPIGGSRSAFIGNNSGHVLRIYMRDASSVVAVLRLASGLEPLHRGGCPTLVVDNNPPDAVGTRYGYCAISPRQARFEVAKVIDRALDSPFVLQLLNGEVLKVRLRMERAGYRVTEFSLLGSKQAVKSALPPGTVIVGD